MTATTKKSIRAVVAGVLAIIIVTTIVDIVLHAIHVYPPMDQPMNSALALLATAYRVVISVAGAYLTARLAPDRPLRHAMILGFVGVVLGLVALSQPGIWDSGPDGTLSRSSSWRSPMLGWREDPGDAAARR